MTKADTRLKWPTLGTMSFDDFVSDVAEGKVATTPRLQALAHRYRDAHVNRVLADRKHPLRLGGYNPKMHTFDEDLMAVYDLVELFDAAFRRAIGTPTSELEAEAKIAADTALKARSTLFEVEPP